jgi:glutaredoxin 3
MQPVTLYTKPFCPYCARALALLDKKGVAYTEVDDASYNPERRREMNERSGRNTFPQIFIGEEHIGGCDDLMALEFSGQLDAKLNA